MKKLLALPAMFLTGAATAFADAPTLPTPLGDGVTLSDYISVAIGGLGGIVVGPSGAGRGCTRSPGLVETTAALGGRWIAALL